MYTKKHKKLIRKKYVLKWESIQFIFWMEILKDVNYSKNNPIQP